MDLIKKSTFMKGGDRTLFQPSTERDQFEKLKRDGLPLREDLIHEAKKGNPRALNSIGSAYYSRGGKSNYAKSLMWYQMAAEKGNPQAQNMIGTMYQQGKGTRKSDVSAIEYYLKSAKQGYPKAMSNLALMYRHGFGTGVNHLKAIMWYSRSANSGESLAQYNIETMYKEHPLSNDEYKKLVQLHTDDAEQGNPYAEYNLGVMYRDGRGVTADKDIAMDWFVKSASQGHHMAMTELPKDIQIKVDNKLKDGSAGSGPKYPNDREKTPKVDPASTPPGGTGSTLPGGTGSTLPGGTGSTPPLPEKTPPTPPSRVAQDDASDQDKRKIKDQEDMLQVLQQQMQRDKWEKDQMLKRINELTYMVEALTRNYKGSSNNSDPMSPGNSVIGTMDRRRISEYVGDQLNQLDAMANRESEDERELRLYRERERRDLELEHLKREYEARIRQLREQQFRGQPSREQQNREDETMGPTTYPPQAKGLLLESQYPHDEENRGPFHINDDPAHYDVYYDSEPEDKVNYEDAVSNHSRTNSFRRPNLSSSNNNSDKSSVYSGGQLNSNHSNPVYINDQASVYSNGYPNTNYDRASTFSEGIPSNDRSRIVDYGIQSNYVERGSNSSNGHPSPYSISSDRNSSNSSTVGPTTIYGSNPINMYNSPPPMYGNSTHLGVYSTSPTNGYINNYSGMNSGYTSSSHRSHHEDENQLTLERRQSELDAHYTELMEMTQK